MNPTANDSFWVKWRTLVGLNSYPMTDYETVLLAHANGASRVLEGTLPGGGGQRNSGGGGCEKLREKHEYNSARPQNCCCNPPPRNSVWGAHE